MHFSNLLWFARPEIELKFTVSLADAATFKREMCMLSVNQLRIFSFVFITGYGYLTQMLMKLTNDKLIMALEGGFELEALCDCTETCIRTLRGETNFSKLSDQALTSKPNPCAVQTIRKVIAVQGAYNKTLPKSDVSNLHHSYSKL